MTTRTLTQRAVTALAALAVTAATLGLAAPAAQAVVVCPVNDGSQITAAAPGVDWSGCDLSFFDLRNVDLHGSNLVGVNIRGANFSGSNLDGVNLSSANGAWEPYSYSTNLAGVSMVGANLSGADLSGADVSLTDLSNSFATTAVDFSQANFSGSNLTGVQMPNSAFLGAFLISDWAITGADFSGSTFDQAKISPPLTNVDFSNASFYNTGFYGEVNGSNFRSAYMEGAKFRNGSVSGSDFTNAYMERTYFSNETVSDSNFHSADMEYSESYSASFIGSNFTIADMSHLVTSDVSFTSDNFTSATLFGAFIVDGRVSDSNFADASLFGITIATSTVSGSNFTGVDFSRMDASGSSFSADDFTHANLINSNFDASKDAGDIHWSETTCPGGELSEAHESLSCTHPSDTTLPSVSGAVTTGTAGAHGWYTSPVTVTWSCTDNALVSSCPTDSVLTTEGGAQTVTSGVATDAAGNEATGSLLVSIDTLAPSLVGTVTRVGSTSTVDWVCSDATSGVAQCPAQDVVTAPGDSQVSHTVVDAAGNETTTTVDVTNPPVDTTPPTVTGNVIEGTLGANGWYTTPITVTWTCNDDTQVATCPKDSSVNTEGATQTVTSDVATDTAGNEATGDVTVNIDTVKPTLVGTVTLNGSTSTVDWVCSDVTSGVVSCPNQDIVTTPGHSQVSQTVTDQAGNETTTTVDVTNPVLPPPPPVDTTPPTVTGTIFEGTLGAHGWYTTPVTVTWTCNDDTAVATCPKDSVVNTNGAAQIITSGVATDTAGNEATGEVTVNIDTVKPTIDAVPNATPTTGTTYTAPLTINYTCEDATSGISSCATPVTLTYNGTYTFTGSTTDKAGNTNSTSTTVTITGGTDPFTLSVPTIEGVVDGKTYPYATHITPTCSATVHYPTRNIESVTPASPTCSGTTITSLNGTTHTYTATASFNDAGLTLTSHATVTWYTAAKPVVKTPTPHAPVAEVHFPTSVTGTRSGHPVVLAGHKYTLTLTVPKGTKGVPQWLTSVQTNATGLPGTPRVVMKKLTFTRVNATTWKVVYTPTASQRGEFRKFIITIGKLKVTTITFVK
jgi:uncharacterized protein YjbI with pentapeptide repeats